MDGSEWADDDPAAYRPPLPPEDRIWRHPSELGARPGPAPGCPPAGGRRPDRPRLAVPVGVMALGALLVTGLASVVLGPARRAGSPPTAAGPAGLTTAAGPAAVGGDHQGVIRLEVRTGSGPRDAIAVVVEGTGFLVTTLGAVAEAREVLAVLPEGRRVPATVTATDAEAGAVVLRVADAPAPARTGQAADLSPGDPVATVGPAPQAGRVVRLGVSADGPDDDPLRHLLDVELADESAVREGEPLVDASGAIVALCTRSHTGNLLGVAAEVVRAAARSVAATGRLAVPWLGVSGNDGDASAVVAEVRAGSPAAAGGIEPGDAVVAVDGKPVRTMAALALLVRERQVGDRLELLVRRDGEVRAVTVTLGERPPDG